jgi:hypothetical protein
VGLQPSRELLKRPAAVTHRVFFLGTCLAKRLPQLIRYEERVVTETAVSSWRFANRPGATPLESQRYRIWPGEIYDHATVTGAPTLGARPLKPAQQFSIVGRILVWSRGREPA